MGLSETIIAACIGASATISTAVFQLLRARTPVEQRPRRSRIRSYLSIFVMMLASAGTGFIYSELRNFDTRSELAALRQEFAASLATQPAQAPSLPSTLLSTGSDLRTASIEALAGLDAGGQPLTLCAALPAGAHARDVSLYTRVASDASAWVAVPLDASGAGPIQTDGGTFSLAGDPQVTGVCVKVGNSGGAGAHLVRLVVGLGYGETI